MKDVIMDAVWKRREQMLREHGGMEGLLKEVVRIETERLQAEKQRRLKRRKSKASSGAKPSLQSASKRSNKSTSRVKSRSRNVTKVLPADPLLDRIHRARQNLIAQHGSVEAYLDDVIRRDADRRRKLKERRSKTIATKQNRTL